MFFIREKHPKYRGNRVASACGYLNSQRSALSQAARTVMVGRHRIAIACAADGDGGDGCVCARVCARARVRVRACVCVRVRARACVYARVRACVCACVMCLQYSRTPLIRPPSESHWCGRIRGMVAREGFVYEQKPLSVTRNVVV